VAKSAERFFLVLLLACPAAFAQNPSPDSATPTASFPVTIQIDAGRTIGEMKPIWRFFGADEPNYATMKDGRQLIGALGEMRPGHVYFRAHNLLSSGDGTPAYKWGSTNAYREDAAGRPIYDWTIVDRIFDTYLARGVRPLAQIGFMPEALSVQPQPYQHDWRPGLPYSRIGTGWAHPPKDYAKWGELVYQWVKHCVERYGKAEVEQWYWEVWNEPNGASYWKASPEEFYKLHDYAVDAVRRALPTARVGGPHTAGPNNPVMDGFLQHVVSGTNYATGQKGTPTDFLAFHAKGQPRFEDGHVRLGIAAQLQAIDAGFRKIAAVPQLKAKPIIIGESDPDGCAACKGPQLGYRTGTMYSSYTAASIAREYLLADKHGVNLEGAVTWAFEFEDQPYFAGQRVLATNGIDLPVLNVFRMFSRMGGKRLATRSSGEVPLDDIVSNGVRSATDVAAIASLDGRRLCILVWQYHDDDLAGPDATVQLSLEHLPVGVQGATLTHYRIDSTHSNAFTEWQRMGAPAEPNEAQYAQLQRAGKLAELVPAPAKLTIARRTATVSLALPRQAVSLLVLDLK
jgi:xylan 1,4-beta-xylosidase